MTDRNQLNNDLEEAIRAALDGAQAGLWSALPCLVTAVDLVKMTLTAQPAIQGKVQNEFGVTTFVNLPLLADVPIVFPSAGGFTITFPVAVGDEVLVIFSSRCIDAWWQSGGIQKPMEARMHDLSDGFALPGPRSQARLVPSISTTDMQIRNDAGTVSLGISPSGQINIVAPAGIVITGNIAVTGTILATAVQANSVIGGGKNLATHTHSGVTVGGGSSGPPV